MPHQRAAVEQYSKGAPIKEICEAAEGIAPQTLLMWVRRAGVPRRNPDMATARRNGVSGRVRPARSREWDRDAASIDPMYREEVSGEPEVVEMKVAVPSVVYQGLYRVKALRRQSASETVRLALDLYFSRLKEVDDGA